ncbi:MAG: dihydroorotate dehydrogenase [Candidatus Omnitrophota bacterium]
MASQAPRNDGIVDLSVTLGKIKMKNPVTVASGTFGYGKELEDLTDLKKLGAIVTKTVTKCAREGNKQPRIAETASGMLNSIGLENSGIDDFIAQKMPYLKKIGIPVIVSIGGEKRDEFVELAGRLDKVRGVSGIEVNISCPNLEKKGKGLFSQDANLTYELVKEIRGATSLTIITKLTPNVTDIAKIARAARDAGSDAVSLVNTYAGMAIDINTKRPRLGNITGGLSGPAIKPLALKAVWDVYNSVDIPIVGMGGITTTEDAIEFMMCGANAVALGSVNFVYPNKCVEIIDGLAYYINANKMVNIKNLIGSLKIA